MADANMNGTNVSTSHGCMTMKRRIYTQDLVDSEYMDQTDTPTDSIKSKIKSACSCSGSCFRKFILSYFPLIGVLRNYSWRQGVIDDFISGFSVSFLHIPQGLALGLLASVPPVYGLYSTFFPVLIYLIFGTCRHVSMGTNALLSLLTAGVVEREYEEYIKKYAVVTSTPSGLSTTSDLTTVTGATGATGATGLTTGAVTMPSDDDIVNFKVGVASAVAVISGAFLLAMGLLKLGFITSYMSPPFVKGFTTAAAFHIVTSQIPKMLHIKVPPYTGAGKIVKTYIDIFKNIGDSNPADVVIAVISCLFLLGVTIFVNERYRHKLRVPVPVQLIIVVVAILVSHFAELEDEYGVAVVGDVPLGLPAPAFPDTDAWGRIVIDSFVMAILIFTLTISLAKLMAEQHNYPVDSDQELVAYGMCNFVGGFFRCISNCTAPPRTMILSNCSAKSTLNGIVILLVILLTLLVAGQLFVSLPVAVLAAMISTAVKNLLLQVKQVPDLWRLSKPDCFIWVFTCLTCVFGDLDIGIAAGLGISFLTVIVRNQLVSASVGGLSGSEDLVLFGKNRKGVKESKQYRIFYFPSQLFFANADTFLKQLYSKALDPLTMDPVSADVPTDDKNATGSDSYKMKNSSSEEIEMKEADEDIRYVIVECSAMTYIDVAGAAVMKKVCGQYRKVGVTLMLARCPSYTLELLERAGYFQMADRKTVFCDVYDAIACIQQPSV